MNQEEQPIEHPVEEQPEQNQEEEVAAKAAEPACCGECCCKCPCKVLCEPFQKSKLFGKLKKLFMWEKPINSAIALGVFTGVFVLIRCFNFTVYGLFFWAMFLGLLAALGMDIQRIIKFFKGVDEPSRLADKKIDVPAEYIDGFFQLVADFVKALCEFAADVVLLRNIQLSLSMVLGSIILIVLAGHVRLITMLYVAIVICFIWFRLYHEQHEKIDKLAAKVVDMAKEQIKKIKEKIEAKEKPKQQ